MASRVPIVVGILAIAGGITWFALRAPKSDGPTQGSGGLTAANGSASGSGKAAIFAPEGPSLAGSGSSAFDTPHPALLDGGQPIDAPSQRDRFVAQTRDDDWAGDTEAELRRTLRKLAVTNVNTVECRADQCELTIAGTPETVDATVAKLESGLSTVAKSLLLSGAEKSGERMTLRVYALFAR
jgi:hypothetical protein